MLREIARLDPVGEARPALRAYLVSACISAVVISLPFIAIRFPPITDLPQQVAQVRLATEILDGSEVYRFNFQAPGILSYALFALSWVAAGPELAGRLAYFLLGCLWIGGLTLLAREHSRPPVVVPVASIFFFSRSLYWGFASFLFGAAGFFGFEWLERRLRRSGGGLTEFLILVGAFLVLYSCHIFWFALSAAWMGLMTVLSPMSRRRMLARLATPLPVAALAAVWAPQLTASGFESPALWRISPLARFSSEHLTDHFLGGLQGPVEPILLAFIAAWALLAIWQHRRSLLASSARPVLAIGVFLVVLSVLLPDHFQNTLFFAQRWAAVGAALLLVALPAPKLGTWGHWILGLLLLAGISLSTTAVWKRFEDVELRGFEESLAAVPAGSRLLGLEFFRYGELVENQPYFQNHAYAQAFKGGTLGFSFASFPASPVVLRNYMLPPWTNGLEWYPEVVKGRDLVFFDHILVHNDPTGHRAFIEHPYLEPVTPPERWRLYRVTNAIPADRVPWPPP